jgi:hypothetical protein
MSIESSPNGPLICTVDIACVLVPLFFVEGDIMLNVTPSGIDSGAEPIFDWHGEVVVKALGDWDLANAGSKKLGIDSEHGFEGFDAHWAHRRRAGANMVLVLAAMLLAQISGCTFRLSHLMSRDSARGSGCDFPISLHTSNLQPTIRRSLCTISCKTSC